MNENIFREYDIRGVVQTDLPDVVVQTLGKSIGTFFREHNVQEITLGRDCRLSSEGLRNVFVSGLQSAGVTIIDIGVCHTPLLYFSLFHLGVSGGVMITGSHNPPEFNGFKICLGKTTIHGRDIQKINEIAKQGHFAHGGGTVSTQSILSSYWDHIAQDIALKKSLRVVVDAGNGTGGQAAVPLLKRLGCEIVELNCSMDGRFPNHHPDPTIPKNLEQLIATVQQQQADVGIAYDGDADRIGVVDDQGAIIWGDQLMILFARDILKRVPGATFISEVKASQNFYREVERSGGRAIMWKTGHSLIKAKMLEEQAALAGEVSGHIFFAHRYFGFDDAVYATCRLLEIISNAAVPLSQLLADVPRTYATPEIRVDCADERKFAVIEEMKQIFQRRYEIIDIDGARVLMPGGWGLVRASNTQPVLVLRFEADSPGRLEEIRSEVESVVKAYL